jgi:hypothetical protein
LIPHCATEKQSPGFALTMEQKIQVADILDKAGVDQIEAGIPAVGPYEQETIREIVRRKHNSKISVWCRMNKKKSVLPPRAVRILSISVFLFRMFKSIPSCTAIKIACKNHAFLC